MYEQETIDLLGALGALYADDTVAEIMVDGYDRVYVERRGALEDVPSPFADNAQLMALITALTGAAGRAASEAQPVVDFRLPDGSRTNAVLPPVALTGPTLVIRKRPARSLTIEDLLGFGCWSGPMVDFLRACVQARLNIVVTGGTSSGKTTVLNLIAGLAPLEERLIVVENHTELRLPHRRLVRLESRPPDPEGHGAVSIRELVVNATHMRPDRIVLGEATGPEALEMLQAMNNGYDGSLFSLHATSPRDALTRLETLGLMAAPELPLLDLAPADRRCRAPDHLPGTHARPHAPHDPDRRGHRLRGPGHHLAGHLRVSPDGCAGWAYRRHVRGHRAHPARAGPPAGRGPGPAAGDFSPGVSKNGAAVQDVRP